MSIKNLALLFTMIVGLFIIIPSPTLASEDSEDVIVEKNNGEVIISIKEKGDYYEIYKGESLVYKGKDNIYKENMDYDSQKYRIGIYRNGKLEKVVSLKVAKTENHLLLKSASNLSKEEIIEETLINTKLETIIGDDYVKINWPDLPDKDQTYEIFRDEVKIAETTDNTFTDVAVKPGEIYKYTVKVENVLSEKARLELEEKAKEYNIELEENNFVNESTVSTLIIIPDNSKESLEKDQIMSPLVEGSQSIEANGLASVPPFFDFTYRTFIPFNSVKNLNPLSQYKFLKGDGRSEYSPYTDKFRTEATVYAQFDYPPALALYKEVKPTYYCLTKECSNPKYLDTEPDTGIRLTKVKENRNDLEWKVSHSVGIPIADIYPNIDYNYYVQATPDRLGAFGSHDAAPSHELLLNYPDGSILIQGYQVTSESEFFNLFGKTVNWVFDM